MRMIVLGAGASFGRAETTGPRPPLTHEFFSRAVSLGIFDETIFDQWQEDVEQLAGRTLQDILESSARLDLGDEPGHLAVLKEFVSQQLGIEPGQYSTKRLDIERLMGLVEGELLGYHGLLRRKGVRPTGPAPADVLQQQLYLVMCGTLVATAAGRCPRHEALAASLNPGDAVLSFNYDLLVDRALRAECNWYPNDGYGLVFHRVGHREGENVEWREPRLTDSSVTLLKPHGSLNWLFPADASQTNLNLDLHGIQRPTPPKVLYCLEDMHTDFLEDHPVYEWWEKYEHESDGRIWDMLSLIVPPAVTKPYRNLEPLIGGVWAQALELLLSSVEELVLVGYSLRAEDLRSWWLFKKAAEEGRRLRKISVVNPSDDVLPRVRNVFGGKHVDHPASTLEEFVAT